MSLNAKCHILVVAPSWWLKEWFTCSEGEKANKKGLLMWVKHHLKAKS
jgi:hypothetical protein